MKNLKLKIFIYALLAVGLIGFFLSCTKEDAIEEDLLSILAEEQTQSLESRGSGSKHGCFDLVFPVNIKLTDGSIVSVPTQDSLKKLLRGYCMAKDSAKPELTFPVSIKAQDGTLLVVNSKEELKALKAECFKNLLDSLRQHDPRDRKDSLCFTLNYPITIKKSDGSTVTVQSKQEFKDLLKSAFTGKNNRPKKGGIKLEFVFPIMITKSDGSQLSLNSLEDIKTLIKSCEGN